jgi:hypothetical protein
MTEHEQMIADCEARESRMTEWECGFIDSISRQERPLSDKQSERLEAIWDRVTARG